MPTKVIKDTRSALIDGMFALKQGMRIKAINAKVDDYNVDLLEYDLEHSTWIMFKALTNLRDFEKTLDDFCGHYNYYVMDSRMWDKVKYRMPAYLGVYVNATKTKLAARRQLKVPEPTMVNSMMRCLYRDAKVFYSQDYNVRLKLLQDGISIMRGERDKYKQKNAVLEKRIEALKRLTSKSKITLSTEELVKSIEEMLEIQDIETYIVTDDTDFEWGE